MSARLMALLEEVRVEEVGKIGGLQVFGLGWDAEGSVDYTTLDEVLAAGGAEVVEVSDAGQVSALRFVNKSDRMVLLLNGEALVGAKQNRVLHCDILVAAKHEQLIPVSCVEQGRWHRASRRFSSPGHMVHASLRHLMARSTHQSYRFSGVAKADQVQVWTEVERKLKDVASSSPTHALHQVYVDHQARLDRAIGEIALPERCAGAAFAVGGSIAGLDLFDKPATCAKVWPKMLRGFALEAIDVLDAETPAVQVDAVREWVVGAARVGLETFRSPGLGDDVRLDGERVVGSCLTAGGEPLHLELFAKPEPRVDGETETRARDAARPSRQESDRSVGP